LIWRRWRVIPVSRDGSDFHPEISVLGVEGFLEIELGLEVDKEIARDAEAELDAQGRDEQEGFFIGRIEGGETF